MSHWKARSSGTSERERAEAAVRYLRGVLSVRNSISLKPRVAPFEIKQKIEAIPAQR